jgi:hypothetical protein
MGWPTLAILRAIRLTNRPRTAYFWRWFMRKLGPWPPEHGVGRANLVAALPDTPAAEIVQILAGVWNDPGSAVHRCARASRCTASGKRTKKAALKTGAKQASESERYRPVLIRVHSRFIRRCVAAS